MKKINSSPSGSVELRRRTEECFKARQSSYKSKKRVQRVVKKTQQLIQELQRHQVELEMQSEALQRTLEALKTFLGRYSGLCNFVPMSTFAEDGDRMVRREASVQKTIFVIDDEPEKAAMISRYLNQEGYDTVMTPSGSEAPIRVDGELPVAITLDVINPDTDGWKVLQGLKKRPEIKDIPVIMVSIMEDRDTGFPFGAIGYITDPLSKKRLNACK
jgi:CheY-like chemotaxis protein